MMVPLTSMLVHESSWNMLSLQVSTGYCFKFCSSNDGEAFCSLLQVITCR